MEKRNQTLSGIETRVFDLVIIGAGIVGAGIALDAASRGLSVLILDKGDFASGTSGKTTKLIHGGLRYVEQYEFALCRELCNERSLLSHLAPHQVKDQSFIMPLMADSFTFNLKANIGLTIYDLIASNWSHRHRKIKAKEVFEAAPVITSNSVVSGLRFYDCICDDTRFVLEVIKAANRFNAVALNYMEVMDCKNEDGNISKITVKDRCKSQLYNIQAYSVINASGVWSDQNLKNMDPAWENHVIPAKGTHIVLPQSAIDVNVALLLPSSDGRFVFVIPWQRSIIVGTTDISYDGPLDNPKGTAAEIEFLINEVNRYFENKKIALTDIRAVWSGLRPLVDDVKKSNSNSDTKSVSRKHIIIDSPNDTITVIGGKLTNYRIIASEVIDYLLKKKNILRPKIEKSVTHNIMLGGFTDKTDFLNSSASISARARKLGIEPATIEHLLSSYGKEAHNILDLIEAQSEFNKRICPDFPPIYAEIPYNIKNEMAISLQDIMYRRNRLAMVNQIQSYEAATNVARLMQNLIGWDDNRYKHEIAAFQNSLEENMEAVIANFPNLIHENDLNNEEKV